MTQWLAFLVSACWATAVWGLPTGLPSGLLNGSTDMALQTVQVFSSAASWDLSKVLSRHRPKGPRLDDQQFYSYLDHLASVLQITNCDNKYGALKLPEAGAGGNTLKFPVGLEQKTKIANNSTSMEVVHSFSSKQPPAKKLDWIQYLLNGNGLLVVDHEYQRILVSFRSDLELSDYFTIYHDQASNYWPIVYTEGFWNNVKKDASPETVKPLYETYRKNYWRYYRSNYLKSNKVHSGYYKIAERLFEDIFVHYLETKERYPDYELCVVGHSMGGSIASLVSLNFHHLGIDNLLITFNSPKLWSNSMADMYDGISRTKDITKVDMGLKTGHLRVWNTKDSWNLFPPTSVSQLIFSKAYKHSGLSIATEQERLPFKMDNLVIEYDLLGKWDYQLEKNKCKFIKSTDEFKETMSWDAHTYLIRDIWACVDLKPDED